MIGQLFHRRRAERLARLLEQADGGPRRHSRSPVDDRVADELAIGRRLATLELSRDAGPAPAFRAELRARLVSEAKRPLVPHQSVPQQAAAQPVAPAQRRPEGGRIYADASPGATSTRVRTGGTRSGGGTTTGTRARRPRRTRVAIVAGIAGGALALSGMSMASGDAMPGDPLYSMKRSTESAQLVLAGSDIDRGQAYLNFARTRGREAAVTKADPGKLIPVLGDLDSQTTDGVRLLTSAAVSHHDATILARVDAFVADQRPVLTDLLNTVSQPDRPRARQSLDLLTAIGTRATALRKTMACAADGRSDALGPLPPVSC
jgi:hypothetical protein